MRLFLLILILIIKIIIWVLRNYLPVYLSTCLPVYEHTYAISALPTMCLMISLVPSRIWFTRTSRTYLSTW